MGKSVKMSVQNNILLRKRCSRFVKKLTHGIIVVGVV